MKITRDIQSLSEFKQNASKLIKQVRATKQPVVLTVNGKPAAVVQDVESYEQMAEDAEYQATVRALKVAIDDLDHSADWSTHEEVVVNMRKRYGIPE